MDLYNALKEVIYFFIQPFLTALEKIGISEMPIKLGFSSIEWFNISLYKLVELAGTYIILFIFFRFIFRIIKIFFKIVTGGLNI